MRCAEHARLPQGGAVRAAICIRIECVHRVVLSANKDNVMRGAIDRQAAHVKRLRIDVAVDRIGEELAERVGVYVGGGQYGFVRILSLVGVVIPPGEHVLRKQSGREKQDEKGNSGYGRCFYLAQENTSEYLTLKNKASYVGGGLTTSEARNEQGSPLS
jgi:hypothetical protein